MPPACWKYVNCVISCPSSSTCQPMPHAPSVGDSQLSSSKRTSWAAGSMPSARSELEVQVLDVGGRRLEDDLELVVLVQAVRVLAVAAVGGPPRRLHVRDLPRLGTEHAQERLRVHGARADLGVPGLVDQAAALRPVLLERGHDLLEGQALLRRAHPRISRATSRSTRCECRSRSRWVPDEVAVEGLQRAGGRTPGHGGGGAREGLAQEVVVERVHARDRRPGPHDCAHEPVRGPVIAALARGQRGRRSPRSDPAAGRSRAASAARPPGSAPSMPVSVPPSTAATTARASR